MAQPFEGVRILDATHVLAGPFCTYQLALLGAEVIRVERPEPESARRLGPDTELNAAAMGISFLALNANKKSVVVDLSDDRGKDIFRRLAAGSDAVVENVRPGGMDRLGLGPKDLEKINPSLVYCSISGFGQTGPWKDKPAYDHVIQGISGLMSAIGTADSGPVRVGFPMIDYLSGLVAAFAISSALYERQRSGMGQVIDCTMLESTLSIMGPLISEFMIGGKIPQPAGNLAFSGSPFSGGFKTGDGMIMVAANTAVQGTALCRALGISEFDGDPRVADWQRDPGFAAELRPKLEAAFKTRKSEEWEDALAAAGVPSGKVRTVPEIIAHPQITDRDLLHTIDHVPGVNRPITVPGAGFRMARDGVKVTAPPPRHGADTVAVLTDIGYSEAEINDLQSAGVIHVAEPVD